MQRKPAFWLKMKHLCKRKHAHILLIYATYLLIWWHVLQGLVDGSEQYGFAVDEVSWNFWFPCMSDEWMRWSRAVYFTVHVLMTPGAPTLLPTTLSPSGKWRNTLTGSSFSWILMDRFQSHVPTLTAVRDAFVHPRHCNRFCHQYIRRPSATWQSKLTEVS